MNGRILSGKKVLLLKYWMHHEMRWWQLSYIFVSDFLMCTLPIHYSYFAIYGNMS